MVLWMIDAAVNAASTLMDGKKQQEKKNVAAVHWLGFTACFTSWAGGKESENYCN